MKISRTAIKTICLMLTFTAVLMLSGCTSYDNFRRTFIDKETEDSNVIYVGVFEPESGQYKKVGKEEIKGIQLAHSMYSNVKGVRVELIRIDTESDTNTAKAAIESLIKLNPVAIIGSAEEANSMIAAEEARKAKIPMITPSASNPLITENNPYAFRACITYDQRGTGLAEYTIKELSAKKVAIITIQNDSTQEKMRSAFKARLRKEGKKSGPEVVLDESIGINEFNMVKLAKQIQKSGAEVGEVWYIPGGMPHAIGEGITMLEIMEPSDLVVRCEFEREGIVVPEDGRFMGRGLDFCLDIFDYTEYSKEEIMEKCRIEPRVLEATDAFRRVRLVDGTLTSCFFVEKLEVNGPALVGHNRKFNLGVVCAGSCTMEESGQVIRLKAGDSFLIAAGVKAYQIRPEGSVQMVMVYPGKDMDTL